MKKSAIIAMLIVTLSFAAFVGGFYVGKQSAPPPIYIQGVPTLSPATQPAGSVGQPDTPSTNTATTPSGTSPAATESQPKPTETTPLFPLDINTATKEQLDKLPGIGPVLAQAIIDYRNEFGPYLSVEDLLRVPGIGEKKLGSILEYIYVAGGNHEDTSCG